MTFTASLASSMPASVAAAVLVLTFRFGSLVFYSPYVGDRFNVSF